MGGEVCYLHPQTPAVARCTDCAKPICEVCLKRVNTKPYCEACAANHHEQSPFLAFLFALLVPGMGQVYNGDWQKGLVIFLTGWLFVPWIYGIVDAVTVANEIRNGVRESATVPRRLFASRPQVWHCPFRLHLLWWSFCFVCCACGISEIAATIGLTTVLRGYER